MSCDCEREDPVLMILEALAEHCGYTLVSKTPASTEFPYHDLMVEEFKNLSVAEIEREVNQLSQCYSAVSERIRRWRSAYKERWHKNTTLPYYDTVSPPKKLIEELKYARAVHESAEAILVNRVSEEVLAELDNQKEPT